MYKKENLSIYLYRLAIKEPAFDYYSLKVYISDKEDIVTYGESPEDAKNNCKNIIKYLKQKYSFPQDIEIENSHTLQIVSPWT